MTPHGLMRVGGSRAALAAFLLFTFVGVALANPQTAPAAQAAVRGTQDPGAYQISRQDVLNITVFEQPELNGKYTVDSDGTVAFPLVGRVRAAGTTVRQVEVELRRLLVDGFFKDPHVSVTLDQFRGRRVFVFGGVNAPGMYPLPDGATLIEILAKAGYAGASEVVVVRTPGATGPVLPSDNGNSQVIRVNLRELEKDVEDGVLSRNVMLQDADTIYVPRVDRNRVFVSGEVKNPGAFSVPEGTTVLQLLSLAGGVTEAASTSRIKIIRIVDGKKKEIKVKLEALVEPGDTVVVPTRFF
jgi:polysaccharide biosynthesis/export protein